MPTQLQKISKTPQPLSAICTSATSPAEHRSAAWHLDRTSWIPVCALCLLSWHRAPLERAWLFPVCNLPSGTYRHLWDPPWASLLQAELESPHSRSFIIFLAFSWTPRGHYSVTEHWDGSETGPSILCTFRKQAVTLPFSRALPSCSWFLLEAAEEEGCWILTIPMWPFSSLFFLCFAEVLWHNFIGINSNVNDCSVSVSHPNVCVKLVMSRIFSFKGPLFRWSPCSKASHSARCSPFLLLPEQATTLLNHYLDFCSQFCFKICVKRWGCNHSTFLSFQWFILLGFAWHSPCFCAPSIYIPSFFVFWWIILLYPLCS